MDNLLATDWVHVFEEDTADGAVFRPEHAEIPLSRRPRERLRLRPNGKATVLVQGEDDRYVERSATWHDEDGTVVLRARGGPTLRIIDRSPSRLIVKMERL
jgi:hypothetical protein